MRKSNSDYFFLMLSKKRTRIGLMVWLAGFVFACGTALYLPKENAGISNEDLNKMLKGRAAYINKCGNCHALILPDKHSAGEWKIWVEKMALKADLTTREQEEILKYVTKNDNSALSAKINTIEKK